MSSCYWARFRRRQDLLLRFETRVYLEAVEAPGDTHPCIGAIIGKNPGSAQPTTRRRGPVAIDLDGDRFLPNVRAIVSKSYEHAAVAIPPGAFVSVLNLFYLCDRDLRRALATRAQQQRLPRCPTEAQPLPWAWYAWGGDDARLRALKDRFGPLQAGAHFFYDGDTQKVLEAIPEPQQKARHTQGLPHEPVVTFLADLLQRS